jgi:hypothetical protein
MPPFDRQTSGPALTLNQFNPADLEDLVTGHE